MATLELVRHRFYNNDGTLASGGKVYTYVAGTSTAKDSYTDYTGVTPNAWPLILDAKGEGAFWVSGLFKMNLLQSDNTQVTGYPVDYAGNSLASLALTGTTTAEKLIIGNIGTESAGVNINGTTYESLLKVSDIAGTNNAQNILHRHSTTLEPMLLGARSNSNTTSETDITASQKCVSIVGAGYAGSNYKLFGSMNFSADATGTISNTSAPGRWSVSVTPNGSITPVEVAYIGNDGIFHATIPEAAATTPFF